MKRTCKLVVENGSCITGVKIGELFFPFENQNEANEIMMNFLDSTNAYYARSLVSKSETAINEIVAVLMKNNLLPVPCG